MKHVPRILGRIDFGERVIYRGHADDGWELKASIGRNYTGAWDTVAPREQQALEEFKKRSIPYIRHRPATDIEWLCLMQHHGCATRLLDFTSNPLIALFFASEQVEGKDGKDGKLIIAKDTPPYPGTLELSLFDHLGEWHLLKP